MIFIAVAQWRRECAVYHQRHQRHQRQRAAIMFLLHCDVDVDVDDHVDIIIRMPRKIDVVRRGIGVGLGDTSRRVTQDDT